VIVGFVHQVGYVVDGDILHVAIVAPGTSQKKIPRFRMRLCPAKMHQQQLAMATRTRAPAPIAPPAAAATPISEPEIEIDERIERVTGLRLPKGKFEMFVFTPFPEMLT